MILILTTSSVHTKIMNNENRTRHMKENKIQI